jgi:hypothetical protein
VARRDLLASSRETVSLPFSTRIERWSPTSNIESRNIESRRGGRAAISCLRHAYLRHAPLAASRRAFLRLRGGQSRVS